MKNKVQLIVLAAAFLFAALLLFLWKSTGVDSNGSNTNFHSFNWDKKYGFQSKDPKGLYLFFSLLKFKHPKQKILEINSPNKFDSVLHEKKNATFLFIGDTVGLLNSELKQLLAKYNQGSTLFFSSNVLGANIEDTLLPFAREDIEFKGFAFSESTSYRFDGQESKFWSQYQTDTLAMEWNGYNLQNLPFGLTGNIDGLVKQNSLITFLRIKGSKSNVYFQTNPEPFMNYQMKTKDGFRHADFVLNSIPEENPVYYISTAQVKPLNLDEENNYDGEEEEQSLMELILNNRTLMNSMILVFLGATLFIIFRSKRRKVVIPIIQKQEGITQTFVQTVASIFLTKQNPYIVQQIQKKNFFDTVLRHYYVDLHRKNDPRDVEVLAEKTGYPLDKMQKLIKELRYENQAISNEYVRSISKLQHDFYRHCGIIGKEEIRASHIFEVNRNIWITSLILISGLTTTSLGLYLLINSKGSGVILWVIGFLLIAYGLLRIIFPHLKVEGEKVTYFNVLGIKNKDENTILKKVENTKIELEINGKEVFIPTWDTLNSDIAQLKRFIHQNKNL